MIRWLATVAGLLVAVSTVQANQKKNENSKPTRPNLVWIVGEDLGPELGCYGDKLAHTPHIDALAEQGMRYLNCYTHAPVCAPSRSGLITGRYPTSIGSHHMRSTLLKPPQTFTSRLRQAGYKVFWPGKTDFNFAVPKDAFDSTANWAQNIDLLPKDQPFFAYINFTGSHESQTRHSPEQHAKITAGLKPNERQDASKFELPPYYPDTPEVRRQFKQYYEVATLVDRQVGDVLAKLDKAGLADNTVVVFFGDHGRGFPRSKRWVYRQGTHVPLIVRWPGHLKPGSVTDELVAFVDLSATMLSLAGMKVPDALDGNVFLGENRDEPRKYVYAARDRMDERYDRIRSVIDKQYQYIRNFEPELPYAQWIQYNEQNPIMRSWREEFQAGRLNPTQAAFFAEKKPPEELYDLASDPHCVNNLAGSKEHESKLVEMRTELDRWIERTGDLGAVPERELIARGLVADRLKEYDQRKRPGEKK